MKGEGDLPDNIGALPGVLFLFWEGRMKRGMLWIVVLGILMAGLAAGPELWAAPGQSPGRQTVPTRTPQPPPTEPPPPPPPPPPPTDQPTPPPVDQPSPPPLTDQPTPNPATVVKTTSAEGASDPFLPEAGGWSVRFHLGATMILAGLLVLVVVRQRV